ncbi:MAG: DUF4190 domain-containing protein [Gordonia sp. (in: high G+C Gram-positive bacteria)]|uniref:DUF4190 domain-containing protein n=1 Tax=Gordonia sp. (in: high G+C Gram-positive bacteria) TaxID=84139 RepID=UPI003BB49AA6
MSQPVPTTPQSSTKATWALVCAIASLVIPYAWFIPAIAAIILGTSARAEIRAAQGTITGDGRARAAVIIGAISLVLGLIVVIYLVS